MKAIVVAAAAIVGIAVLLTAFSGSGSPAPSAQVPPASATTAPVKPVKSPKAVRVKPSPQASPAVDGVRVGVYNATSTNGLATTVGDTLQSQGYTIKETGEGTDTSTTSAVYYLKTKDQESAQALADKNFKKVTAEVLPTGFNIKNASGDTTAPAKGVQIVVIVGEDYKAK